MAVPAVLIGLAAMGLLSNKANGLELITDSLFDAARFFDTAQRRVGQFLTSAGSIALANNIGLGNTITRDNAQAMKRIAREVNPLNYTEVINIVEHVEELQLDDSGEEKIEGNITYLARGVAVYDAVGVVLGAPFDLYKGRRADGFRDIGVYITITTKRYRELMAKAGKPQAIRTLPRGTNTKSLEASKQSYTELYENREKHMKKQTRKNRKRRSDRRNDAKGR